MYLGKSAFGVATEIIFTPTEDGKLPNDYVAVGAVVVILNFLSSFFTGLPNDMYIHIRGVI